MKTHENQRYCFLDSDICKLREGILNEVEELIQDDRKFAVGINSP